MADTGPSADGARPKQQQKQRQQRRGPPKNNKNTDGGNGKPGGTQKKKSGKAGPNKKVGGDGQHSVNSNSNSNSNKPPRNRRSNASAAGANRPPKVDKSGANNPNNNNNNSQNGSKNRSNNAKRVGKDGKPYKQRNGQAPQRRRQNQSQQQQQQRPQQNHYVVGGVSTQSVTPASTGGGPAQWQQRYPQNPATTTSPSTNNITAANANANGDVSATNNSNHVTAAARTKQKQRQNQNYARQQQPGDGASAVSPKPRHRNQKKGPNNRNRNNNTPTANSSSNANRNANKNTRNHQRKKKTFINDGIQMDSSNHSLSDLSESASTYSRASRRSRNVNTLNNNNNNNKPRNQGRNGKGPKQPNSQHQSRQKQIKEIDSGGENENNSFSGAGKKTANWQTHSPSVGDDNSKSAKALAAFAAFIKTDEENNNNNNRIAPSDRFSSSSERKSVFGHKVKEAGVSQIASSAQNQIAPSSIKLTPLSIVKMAEETNNNVTAFTARTSAFTNSRPIEQPPTKSKKSRVVSTHATIPSTTLSPLPLPWSPPKVEREFDSEFEQRSKRVKHRFGSVDSGPILTPPPPAAVAAAVETSGIGTTPKTPKATHQGYTYVVPAKIATRHPKSSLQAKKKDAATSRRPRRLRILPFSKTDSTAAQGDSAIATFAALTTPLNSVAPATIFGAKPQATRSEDIAPVESFPNNEQEENQVGESEVAERHLDQCKTEDISASDKPQPRATPSEEVESAELPSSNNEQEEEQVGGSEVADRDVGQCKIGEISASGAKTQPQEDTIASGDKPQPHTTASGEVEPVEPPSENTSQEEEGQVGEGAVPERDVGQCNIDHTSASDKLQSTYDAEAAELPSPTKEQEEGQAGDSEITERYLGQCKMEEMSASGAKSQPQEGTSDDVESAELQPENNEQEGGQVGGSKVAERDANQCNSTSDKLTNSQGSVPAHDDIAISKPSPDSQEINEDSDILTSLKYDPLVTGLLAYCEPDSTFCAGAVSTTAPTSIAFVPCKKSNEGGRESTPRYPELKKSTSTLIESGMHNDGMDPLFVNFLILSSSNKTGMKQPAEMLSISGSIPIKPTKVDDVNDIHTNDDLNAAPRGGVSSQHSKQLNGDNFILQFLLG